MPITAISDPTNVGFNAYCTPTEVTTYFTTYDPRKLSRWYDDGYQNEHCILATQIINDHYKFIGSRTTADQNLEWPRKDVPRDGIYGKKTYSEIDTIDDLVAVRVDVNTSNEELDDTTIPAFLLAATAEMALIILENPTYSSDGLYANVTVNTEKRVKIGSIEVENFEEDLSLNIAEGVIKATAYQKLSKYGTYLPSISTPGYGGIPSIA